MVKLRLKRMGRKKRPFYRIVAMDINNQRDGAALAEVGVYDPIHAKVEVDSEAAISWLNQGAQMSDTVQNLFRSQGILATWRGFEGAAKEGALDLDKPKRRKKMAAAASAAAKAEAEGDDAAEQAPAPAAEADDAGAAEATESTEDAAAEAPAEVAEEPAGEESA